MTTGRGLNSIFSFLTATALGLGLACAAEEYELGGPLAGVKLPLLPTDNGEPAGFPGCIPELSQGQQPDDEGWVRFTGQGRQPLVELRPGSPEIYVTYMHKYLPARSFMDRQSLLKSWEAPALSGKTESYAAPVCWVSRYHYGEPTGRFWKPRPVARTTVKAPVFSLDLGDLPIGLYAVKVVGAVESNLIERVRKPLFVTLTVNDGLAGEVSRYRQRISYVDDFESVAELYFHAPEKRAYKAELFVDEGSQVPLLVWGVELHDILAGLKVEGLKTRATLCTAEERDRLRVQFKDAATVPGIGNSGLIHEKPGTPPLTPEQRLARDAALWNTWIPLNAQPCTPAVNQKTAIQGLAPGVGDMSPDAIETKFGKWEAVGSNRKFDPMAMSRVLMRNAKLGLEYSLDDYRKGRTLPDPYPFKDDGYGLLTPNTGTGAPTRIWAPVAAALDERALAYTAYLVNHAVPSWHYAGNRLAGRDAALMLVRLAYDWPALTANLAENLATPGLFGIESRFRQRNTNYHNWPWYTEYATFSEHYDQLFDLIQGNEELAQSVHRFVPWVNTSKDVVALLDAYLLRATAKKILRYNWHTGEMNLALLATVQDHRPTTDPWMKWLFTKTFVYPLPLAGLNDVMVTGCERNGPEYIGSISYALGESALPKAKGLEPYLRAGGDPAYNLSDPKRYPKPVMMCYWPLDITVAGRHFLRIGDVAGPDRPYGVILDNAGDLFRQGWAWTKDPTFAWLVKHELGRTDHTDAEWKELEAAAGGVARAPWLDTPSRAVPQWAAVLEAGRQHDDFRFRRTAYVRTGMGWGHQHHDSLDLQLYAHGLPMTVDGGQRAGYSRPNDKETRVHNLVEVDGMSTGDGQWISHSWTRALADLEGAQYLRVEAVPSGDHPDVKAYSRQVALIDVNEGSGSVRLEPDQLKSMATLPPNVITPDSYVFDVVRVSGGKRHTYCFHAGISDEVAANTLQPVAFTNAPEKDQLYLQRFSGQKSAGAAPENLSVTWRTKREREGNALGETILGPNFSTNAPRHYTRLHLLGVEGQRVLRGASLCKQWSYQLPMVFVQKRGADEDNTNAVGTLESAYAAVIEPFAGQPFLGPVKRLAIPGNETDAQQAVAVAVETADATGRRDLCFADGRAERVRSFADGGRNYRIAAEYAFCSVDAGGLRQAVLAGGTRLETPEVTLIPAAAERKGRVLSIDYGNKIMTVEGGWPLFRQNATIEAGTNRHWTSITVTGSRPEGANTVLSLYGGADFYLSRVKDVNASNRIVTCGLGLAQLQGIPAPGLDRDWVASNEAGTKFWRARYLGGERTTARFNFQLDGKVEAGDFGSDGGFRLWEYGTGDTVRQSTGVSLRRVKAAGGDKPAIYELTSDVTVEVTMNGKTRTVTLDELKKTKGSITL